MKKFLRYSLLVSYIVGSLVIFYLLGFIFFTPDWNLILTDWSFWLMLLFYAISIEEFVHWARIDQRSEMSDFIAIAFFFFLIFFITKDLMTSLMGALSIYLWVGVFELKEYPILNKILIISLVTYNVIFIAGLFSFYLGNPFFLNTAFSFSFWIILILGFMLFGRKYIVIWRFMSPEYLTLFLYIIAWLAISFIDQFTPIDFIYGSPLIGTQLTILTLVMNIYFVLILVNWIVYFISGPILDKMLGIKRVEDEKLLELVEQVKNDVGIKGNIKVGFGKYPILNAMAYGSVFDKRIAIIAEDMSKIPEDELKGIVAHELSHLKGKHTLILTVITVADLVIRMFLGIPATYYDYTFGNPQLPMIAFILLNMVIYLFLYVFVRILEGKADLMSKKCGYSNELVKALYNLESFYATGREIGLNTMLLCDEKVTRDNQLIDYMDTANYLNNSMIKPSRASLLGNFLNSHPPSYHRISAILSDESDDYRLKPTKEALLPFICLKKSKQKKYAKRFEKPRLKFKTIADMKFKELFEIEDSAALMETLNRRELFSLDLEKDYIFKNKITNEMVIGKLEEIQFIDDLCDSDNYIVKEIQTNDKLSLNTSIYTKVHVDFNETYYFQNDIPLILKEIELKSDKKNGNYLFSDKEGKTIHKPILKTKLPNSLALIKNLKDRDLFFKVKGEIKIRHCTNVLLANELSDCEIELINATDSTNKPIAMKFKLKELVIRPKNISLFISKNKRYRETELALIEWLIKKRKQAFIWLKKPVNNLEVGYIKRVNIYKDELEHKKDNDENENENSIVIKNIFGKEKILTYKTVELISFEHDTTLIQKKSDTTLFSRLGYKILKKIKPESVII